MRFCSLSHLLLIALPSALSQSIKIDWSGGTPTLDLPDQAPASERVTLDDDSWMTETVQEVVSPTGRVEEVTQRPALPQTSAPDDHAESSKPQGETPRGSLRATLKRLGVQLPTATDDKSLKDALGTALRAARMPLLRGLLFERGGRCIGCTERAEFEREVLASLHRPLVGRHALPLFLYDRPLFPVTQASHAYLCLVALFGRLSKRVAPVVCPCAIAADGSEPLRAALQAALPQSSQSGLCLWLCQWRRDRHAGENQGLALHGRRCARRQLPDDHTWP